MAESEKVYAETGKMMEKYDVSNTAAKAGGGEYPNQDGLWVDKWGLSAASAGRIGVSPTGYNGRKQLYVIFTAQKLVRSLIN